MSVAAAASAQEGGDTADAPADGGAEGGKYPVQYVKRPLTLPEFMLAPEFGFSVYKFPQIDPLVGIYLGARFGILDDLEVNVTPVPFLVSPEAEYGNPIVGATFRFLDGDFEMGARVNFVIPARKGSDPILLPALPMLLHAGDSIRLDTGVNFAMAFGNDLTVGMFGYNGIGSIDPGIPIRVSIQVMDPLYIQAATGFGILTFDQAGDTIFVPLGLGAGYTIEGEDQAPLVDIGARFEFPFFLTPGSSGDKVNPDGILVGVTGTGYFQL